jgi:hypothetical protein
MGPLDTDDRVQIAGAGPGNNEQAVVAPLEQLFTGLRVGSRMLTVQCCTCGAQLGEGDQVSVYVYQMVETPRWHLARCRCFDCIPTRSQHRDAERQKCARQRTIGRGFRRNTTACVLPIRRSVLSHHHRAVHNRETERSKIER